MSEPAVLSEARAPRPPLRLWLWWVLSAAFASLVGLQLGVFLSYRPDGLPWVSQVLTPYLSTGVFIQTPVIVALAAAQWAVLRAYLPRAYLWIVVTLIGAALGLSLQWVRVDWLALLYFRLEDVWGQGGLTIKVGAYGAALGLMLGMSQWLLLRRLTARAWWWVAASVVGWSIQSAYDSGAWLEVVPAWWLLTHNIVASIPTGLALVWLLRHAPAARLAWHGASIERGLLNGVCPSCRSRRVMRECSPSIVAALIPTALCVISLAGLIASQLFLIRLRGGVSILTPVFLISLSSALVFFGVMLYVVTRCRSIECFNCGFSRPAWSFHCSALSCGAVIVRVGASRGWVLLLVVLFAAAGLALLPAMFFTSFLGAWLLTRETLPSMDSVLAAAFADLILAALCLAALLLLEKRQRLCEIHALTPPA